MEIGNQILFFLAGLGVFNGFLLSIYFLFAVKPTKWVNVLFGLLLLMLCMRIGKSLFHIFTDVPRIYRQIGLTACSMIGPIMYVYLRSFKARLKLPMLKDKIILALSFCGIILAGLIWPYQNFPEVWNNYLIFYIYGTWLFFVIASFPIVKDSFISVFGANKDIADRWLVIVYSSVSILCIAYILAIFNFPYIAGPILFSIVFYLLIVFLFSKKNRSIVLLAEAPKYKNQKLKSQEVSDLIGKLEATMKREQSFLNPKIKLADLASSLGTSSHALSQLINDQLGISFNSYINDLRVKKACQLLVEADHLSVEGIGQEVGFNSRSAFYAAFKKEKGETPAQYKSNQKLLS